MSRITLGSEGWVYLMVSASLDGLIKIGASTEDPRLRAKQLSAATASPTPFHVAYSRQVPDVNETESRMHDIFDADRVNGGREFFSTPLHKAILALNELVGDGYWGPKVKTPFAELFASFPDDGTARELTEEERKRCRELERVSR